MVILSINHNDTSKSWQISGLIADPRVEQALGFASAGGAGSRAGTGG